MVAAASPHLCPWEETPCGVLVPWGLEGFGLGLAGVSPVFVQEERKGIRLLWSVSWNKRTEAERSLWQGWSIFR